MSPELEVIPPRARPVVKRAQRTLASIEHELIERADAFERARDPRCVFARAYAVLTRSLIEALPGAGFSDPAWVAQLATVFADHYFRALRDYDAGKPVTGAWLSVFDAGSAGRTSVIEDLVLGMTAHIVNDLPHALCEVGTSDAQRGSRLADYHLLNDVLGSAIESIQTAVTHRYDPALGLLDVVLEGYDEILTSYGLRLSRATAWYNAERLRDPALQKAAAASIARSPEVALRELLDPPTLSLRIVFRALRVLARLTRTYPIPADRRNTSWASTSTSATSTST